MLYMMETAVSKYREMVSTQQWRDTLIEKITSLETFVALAEAARTPAPVSLDQRQLHALNDAAQAIIAGYERAELASARQYYNNAHLLEFWNFYNTELEKMEAHGLIDADFPLFHVEVDYIQLRYAVTRIPREYFARQELFSDLNNPPQAPVQGRPTLPEDPALRRLFRKLTALDQIHLDAFAALYNVFIGRNRRRRSEVWRYFQIHFFLDNNLYGDGRGRFYKSHFDSIFFNTTIFELKCFLQDQNKKQRPLAIDDIAQFLKRQRDYLVRRALEVTMEENEIGNRRKDLLAYDEQEGVVKPHGVTDLLKTHYKETVVKPFGLIKQDGCPFARSKGLSKNAVVEVFGFFDNLMCELLNFSPEFRQCFGADQRSGRDIAPELGATPD